MAVARMLKVTLVGYTPEMERAIGLLQEAGVIDVTPVVAEGEEAPAGLSPVRVARDDARLRRLEEYLADAQFVRQFLGSYHTVEAPFSAFISEKVHVDLHEFREMEPDDAFVGLYRECESLADEMARLSRERDRLVQLAEDLTPWEGFHLQIGQWRGTEHVVLFTGTVPAARGPAIRQALRDSVREVTVEELGPVGSRSAWVVMAHRSQVDEVRAALAVTDFVEVSFPGLEGYPAEEIAMARERIEEIDRREGELEERARGLAKREYHSVVALVEALQCRLDALNVRERFGETASTFMLTGWVREAGKVPLTEALAPLADAVDLNFDGPSAEDSPPVELENPRLLRPFEVLTDLYGRPRYDEVDPTPLLAPFFFVFFGICIGDVGYGAMLIAAAYLIKTRLDVAPGVRKFMDLLMAGGLSAMIAGVLLGSWFAIDLTTVPASFGWFVSFVRALQVLDPLAQVQPFLLFALALGVIQVFFGVLVAAWDSFRRGDPATAISEQLSTIFLFGMIAVAVIVPGAARWALVVGIGATMVLQGRALEAVRHDAAIPAWDRWLGAGWLLMLGGLVAALALGAPAMVPWVFLGVSAVGLIGSKTIRRSVVSLLGGAFAVYGMTAFIGDILSYTRLAALGLSGALVGQVFNLLGGMLWGIEGNVAVKVVAIAGGILVLAVGHVFNVVINLLGAFVHPARLQFVEFFSKFYEGGGRAFDPFRYRTRSLVLHAGRGRREGGGGS